MLCEIHDPDKPVPAGMKPVVVLKFNKNDYQFVYEAIYLELSDEIRQLLDSKIVGLVWIPDKQFADIIYVLSNGPHDDPDAFFEIFSKVSDAIDRQHELHDARYLYVHGNIFKDGDGLPLKKLNVDRNTIKKYKDLTSISLPPKPNVEYRYTGSPDAKYSETLWSGCQHIPCI